MNNIIFASVISEIKQSPMFMTVKAVICDTPEANLNGARVTPAFVDEVVKNEKRYVGLPLYADVKALTSGKYNRLGHLYDVKTGEFHSTQIGSFYKFEKEKFDAGYHLIGYARIPKRNKKLSNAIAELFAAGRLKFSFEVAVGEYDENEDGTITIDASENNYLEGTAIVTYPACEDAVALELVAQKADSIETVVADDQEGGEQDMLKDTIEQAEVQTEVAEAEEAHTEETVETEPVQAEMAEDTSTAAVYVRETTTEAHEVHAYDTETGKEVHQEVLIRTSTEEPIEGTLVEADDGMHVAEEEKTETAEETTEEKTEEVAEITEEVAEEVVETAEEEVVEETTEVAETEVEEQQQDPPAQDPPADPTPTRGDPPAEPEIEDPATDAVDSKKKTAEQLIAELAEAVEKLSKEVAELKEKKEVAEVKTMTAEINPMMADINIQKTYSLLEKAENKFDAFSLLSKA